MEDLLESIERDEIIMTVLAALCLKQTSENLRIYKNKLRTKDEAFYYLMHVDEIRKAKHSVVWSKK